MGLWEKIFGQRQKQPEGKKTLSIEELKAEAEKRLESEKKSFNNQCFEIFEKIKETINSAEESLEAIKDLNFEEQGDNQFLRKIVQSSKESFVEKMSVLLYKAKPPEGNVFEKNQAYCKNSAIEFQKDFLAFRKNTAYTGILAKKEMTELGKSIEELEKQLLDLHELFKNSKAQEFERILEIIQEVEFKEKEVEEKRKQAEEIEKELEELTKEKVSVLEKTKALKEGEAWKSFEEDEKQKEALLKEKRELKEKAANLLMPLEKQLRKMQALSENKEWILEKEQERMLNAYLQDSFQALKQDPKGEMLDQVLEEVEKAINAGKIKFKDEKEKSKKAQAIQELKAFDFFSVFFWRLNELDKELPKIQERIEKSTLFKQLNSLQASLDSIEREAMQKANEINTINAVKENQKVKIKEDLIKLQEKAKESLEQEIEIKARKE